MNLYDASGQVVAYCDDGNHIFMFSGEPVAYFAGRSVYSFVGRHLGWFGGGWVRDHGGACVLFNDRASGVGPPKPDRWPVPRREPRHPLPLTGKPEPEPARPNYPPVWSDLSAAYFFNPGNRPLLRPVRTPARVPRVR